jgi:ketosteroid isomerase-like protein
MSADSIRTAYDALMTGDVEPLVSLIHPDMTWRGRRRLMRLWKRPPSDTGRTRPVGFSNQESTGAERPEITTAESIRFSNGETGS